MVLSTTAAYGVYAMETRIARVIKALNHIGVPEEDVCIVLPPSHPVAQAVRDANIPPSALHRNPSDDEAPGLLQWLSRFGAVIIPGVAFFVGSRVYLRAVLATSPAPSSSLYSDRLMGLGLPQHTAEHCSERLTRDGIMIFVCCEGASQARCVNETLRRTGAEEASCLEEATATCYIPSSLSSAGVAWMANRL